MRAHIEDHEVEEDEDDVQHYPNNQLQFTDHSLCVLHRGVLLKVRKQALSSLLTQFEDGSLEVLKRTMTIMTSEGPRENHA